MCLIFCIHECYLYASFYLVSFFFYIAPIKIQSKSDCCKLLSLLLLSFCSMIDRWIDNNYCFELWQKITISHFACLSMLLLLVCLLLTFDNFFLPIFVSLDMLCLNLFCHFFCPLFSFLSSFLLLLLLLWIWLVWQYRSLLLMTTCHTAYEKKTMQFFVFISATAQTSLVLVSFFSFHF